MSQPQGRMGQPDAVLLDVDGTLIDSNAAHARAYVDAGRELGRALDYEEVVRLIGMGGDKLLPRAAGIEEESGLGERLTARKKEIFSARYLPELKPTPGARELLHRLRDDGIKLVVATSASEQELGKLLEQAGIGDLIQATTNADEVEGSKPDPDIVLAALERAGFPAERCVMLGDTPYDVKAATGAGVRIVAVRSGGWGNADLEGAIAVYEHPRDILEHYDTSPFGRGG